MKKRYWISFFVMMGAGAISVFAQDSTATSAVDSVQSVVEAATDKNLVELRDLVSFTKILSTLVLLIGTFLFNRALSFVLGTISERRPSYRLIIKRTMPFLNIFIWTMAVFVVIAGILAPPMETILTVGASIGLAVGFASQDILKNVFGGFIILLDRPFQVGDKIDVNGHYGEVTDIGLRSTRIVTPDDSLVSVPNADIVSNSVSNSNSGALDCQVVISIYLPATTPIRQAKEIAHKAAVTSRYIYLKKPIAVMCENLVYEQNFVLHLKVKAYVLDIRYEFLLKSDITELIMQELNDRGLIPSHQNTKLEI